MAFAATSQFQIDMELLKLVERRNTGTDFFDAGSLFSGFGSGKVAPLVVGYKRGTVSTHQSCNIGAEHFHSGDFFKGAQYGIIIERSALDYNLCSDIACFTEFYYFE